jgi:hypothetical protein
MGAGAFTKKTPPNNSKRRFGRNAAAAIGGEARAFKSPFLVSCAPERLKKPAN